MLHIMAELTKYIIQTYNSSKSWQKMKMPINADKCQRMPTKNNKRRQMPTKRNVGTRQNLSAPVVGGGLIIAENGLFRILAAVETRKKLWRKFFLELKPSGNVRRVEKSLSFKFQKVSESLNLKKLPKTLSWIIQKNFLEKPDFSWEIRLCHFSSFMIP